MEIKSQKKLTREIRRLIGNNNIFLYGKENIGKKFAVQRATQRYNNYKFVFTGEDNGYYKLEALLQPYNFHYKNYGVFTLIISIVIEIILFIVNLLCAGIYILLKISFMILQHKVKFPNNFNSKEDVLLHTLLKMSKKRKKSIIIVDHSEKMTILEKTFFNKILDQNLTNNLYKNKIHFIFIEHTENSIYQKSFNQNLVEIRYSPPLEELTVIARKILGKNFDYDYLNKIFKFNNESLSHISLLFKNREIIFGTNEQSEQENEEINEIIKRIISQLSNVEELKKLSAMQSFFDIIEFALICDSNNFEYLKQKLDIAVQRLILTNKEYNFISSFLKNEFYKLIVEKQEIHFKIATIMKKSEPSNFFKVAFHFYKSEKIDNFFINYLYGIYDFYIKTGKEYVNDEANLLDVFYNNCSTASYNKKLEKLKHYLNSFLQNKIDYLYRLFIDDCPNDKFLLFVLIKCILMKKKQIIDLDYNLLKNALCECSIFFKQQNELRIYTEVTEHLLTIISYRLSQNDEAKKLFWEYKEYIDTYEMYMSESTYFHLTNNLERLSFSLFSADMAFYKISDFILKINYEDKKMLYKTLSDSIGYALLSGNFSEIKEKNYSKEIRNLIKNNKDLVFPKQSKYIVNEYIYITHTQYNPKQIKKAIKYIETAKKTEYSIMLEYNLASYFLLDGQITSAEEILEKLCKNANYNDNEFYQIWFNSNLISANILLKKFDIAQDYYDIVLKKLCEYDERFREYHQNRLKYFKEIIDNQEEITPHDLFYSRFNISRNDELSWHFFGKGILFSELMFYNE